MEEENKKVTRRKFLEDSSKKALAGTAAAFLGLGMIKPTPVQAAHCWFSCAGSCSGGCTGSCSGGCTGSCSGGCTGSCGGGCLAGCLAGCLSGCGDGCVLGIGYSAQAEHSTPMSEQEATNRHVTV